MAEVFSTMWASMAQLIERGGWVMWPLMALSVITVALCMERMFFWLGQRSRTRRNLARIVDHLKAGRTEALRDVAGKDQDVYACVIRAMGEAEARSLSGTWAEAVDHQRRRLERFMAALAGCIAIAPMLGILGTVLGIIQSFALLSSRAMQQDPAAIGSGIAEALLTTAVGLSIALIGIIPYNIYRAQVDQALNWFEMLSESIDA